MTKRELLRLVHRAQADRQEQRALAAYLAGARGITQAQADLVVRLARPDQRKVWRQEAQQT